MADVDLVLGAKDRSADGFKSVDESLNRLQQRARVATQSMTKVADPQAMERFAASTKNATNGIAASFKRLKEAAGPLLAVWAAVKSVQKTIGAVSAANDAYDTQTEAVEGLTTALRLNAEATAESFARLQSAGSAAAGMSDPVAGVSEHLQKMAADLQEVAGVGDEVTLGLMQQASMLGIHTDQLDDAAKGAIGLAKATGKSLPEALNLVRQAMQGEFGALGEVIPAIRQASSDTEKLALVNQLAAKGMDAQVEASNRLAGMVVRANNATGDMQERLGELIAPLRLLVAQGITKLAESMSESLLPAIDEMHSRFEQLRPAIDAIAGHVRRMATVWSEAFAVIWRIVKDVFGEALASAGASVQGFAETVTEWSRWMAERILFSITVLEVGWERLPTVLTMVATKMQLVMETIRADIEHALTEVAPAYALWFAANFPQIIQAGTDAAMDVVADFGIRLGEAMGRIMQFIQSGMQGGIGGLTTSLAEIAARRLEIDFAASVGALPEIMGRALTEREVQLQEQFGALGSSLGSEVASRFAERMKGLGDTINKQIETDVKADLQIGAVGKQQSPQLQAVEGRLLTRGVTEDPLLNVANKQAKTLESIDGRLKETLDIQKQPSNNPNLQVEMVA